MVCYVNGECGPAPRSNERRVDESTELPWTDHEELLIELLPQAPQRPSPSVASITVALNHFNEGLRTMALMSVAAGLFIASKLLLEKPADDPDLKVRKRLQARIGKSLGFLILPIFVIMIDCSF